MPGTICQESPPSLLLNNAAGSTPHSRSFLPAPGVGDEDAFAGTNGEKHSIGQLQPPETAGRIVTTSPDVSGVSIPARSRTLSEFTNTFKCRRSLPVSSQTLQYSAGSLRSISWSA